MIEFRIRRYIGYTRGYMCIYVCSCTCVYTFMLCHMLLYIFACSCLVYQRVGSSRDPYSTSGPSREASLLPGVQSISLVRDVLKSWGVALCASN